MSDKKIKGGIQPVHFLLLFFGISILLCIADRAPMHIEARYPSARIEHEFDYYFEGVINRTLPGPYIYRVLIPYSLSGLHQVFSFVSVLSLDLLAKITLLFLCQYCFLIYLENFLTKLESLAGVFLFDLLTGFSLSYIQGPSLIETADILNVLVFIVALNSILNDRFVWLCIVLLIGSLNRETVLFILPVQVIWDRINRRSYTRSLVAFAICLVAYAGVRIAIGSGRSDWFTMEGLARNIPFLSEQTTGKAIVGNLHVIALLGPLLVLSVPRFPDKPKFLRVCAIVVPFFIVAHYAVGTVIEARLWMPLFIFLIPLSIINLSRVSEPFGGVDT